MISVRRGGLASMVASEQRDQMEGEFPCEGYTVPGRCIARTKDLCGEHGGYAPKIVMRAQLE